MTPLDADATFLRLDKLRERMDQLEKHPDPNNWQYMRLLIRALTETVAKARKCALPIKRKVSSHAPEPLRDDWQELVDVLQHKGILSERRKGPRKHA